MSSSFTISSSFDTLGSSPSFPPFILTRTPVALHETLFLPYELDPELPTHPQRGLSFLLSVYPYQYMVYYHKTNYYLVYILRSGYSNTWSIHYDQDILILGYKSDTEKILINTNLCV